MAPLPKNSIEHFIHPGHQLTATDGHDQQYLCDGCKTLGNGKRFRCHRCDFDLHEYCGTCPATLSSTMHHHLLTLVIRKAQGARQIARTCDLCSDPVEGLFYRCKECEFDVHPLCTQFPNKVQHALHKIHPLTLESNSLPGFCAVCKDLCKGWRYRCGACNVDIHLDCILVPIVQCPQNPRQKAQTTQRGIPMFDQGIPFQPPPQYSAYYAHHGYPHGPASFPYGPGYNMYNGQMHGHPVYPNNFVPQNQGVVLIIKAVGVSERWCFLL
ncbi:Cysteine/Histidine-rich C1 domain family protein [Abeliophyllum distichum]|uniref:Cysteine/Histidine-rich C1 domain family protein n=1 Tax=Abeliophyllum distichum TaxID=126358 RepID=A0ABD1QZG5_9LAMI